MNFSEQIEDKASQGTTCGRLYVIIIILFFVL